MKNERRYKVMTYLMVWTLLFSTLAFGQDAGKSKTVTSAAAENIAPLYANYLIEVPAGYDTSEGYAKEAQTTAQILSSKSGTNPVLIDNQGYVRDLVLQSVAARLARDPQGKKLFRVNCRSASTILEPDIRALAICTVFRSICSKWKKIPKMARSSEQLSPSLKPLT